MKLHLAPAALSLVLVSPAAALANGAWSEFPAGGVVFKADKDISIAREDLEIGLERIRVHYVFNSSAGEPLERTIGFPMAKVPLDDSPDNYPDRSWATEGQDVRNYMAFEVAVNGEPLTPRLHEYAWLGDVNVTNTLAELGVSPFAASIDAYEKLAQLPEATVRKLLEEKLAVREGNWLVPQWQYQSVYEWAQTFAPGRTEVEVSYKPLYGSDYGPEPYYPDGARSADYCYDSATKQTLAGLSNFPMPVTVGYILTTAENWNGPIGEFHLKISMGEEDLARFCVPEGLKAVGDGVSWYAEQFVPSSDLNIVFFDLK